MLSNGQCAFETPESGGISPCKHSKSFSIRKSLFILVNFKQINLHINFFLYHPYQYPSDRGASASVRLVQSCVGVGALPTNRPRWFSSH